MGEDERHLYVIGVDEHHRPGLERGGERCGFTVHELLDTDRVYKAASYDVDALLEAAREQLEGQQVDGIASFWDFPSSCVVPILANERGLPAPSLPSVVAFEHKYWSRVVQREVAPDEPPPSAAVDVDDPRAASDPPLDYPFWLKPIKAYSSTLAFRVDNADDLAFAVEEIRTKGGRLGDPFQEVLDRLDLPDEIAHVGGRWAIAEGAVDGHQCTLEGYVHDGEAEVHGVFDIERMSNGSTFANYTYPSELPDEAHKRMCEIAVRLIEHVGFDQGAFNIEFFVDDQAERTWILEVNPRISQEHADIMYWVDGDSNLQVMAETALGRRPQLKSREGPHRVGGKFFHRHAADAIVTTAPTPERVAEIERDFAPCYIELDVSEGLELADLPDQDPYAYELAGVHLAAADKDELRRRYEQIASHLDDDIRLKPQT